MLAWTRGRSALPAGVLREVGMMEEAGEVDCTVAGSTFVVAPEGEEGLLLAAPR